MASLQDSLTKFKKQQEKCQSTRVSIAAKSGSSKATPSKSLAAAKSPAPAVKFSNDTERLQHINSIRKSPVGAQMKRVIDLLFGARKAMTADQINELCYVDINTNTAVFESLRKNLKVNYDGKRFSYKSKHDLRDKDELLVLIRKFPEGISVVDLKDSYPKVMDDLQSLKACGHIWLISSFDSPGDIAYPNDPRANIEVDDDLKQLFMGIELPLDMTDIERHLQKNEMKPATNTAKRRAKAAIDGIPPKSKEDNKKKKSGISKRTKLTNAHLPELFKDVNGT
ncbi:hypothetical protein ACJIZ3_008256 [Penstemon smallii]|uniref:TFIIE beta domain-containing protein n=1 Tax=Penstemon smallii TaxID=265156 RepID=A0ABD3T9Y6_9LAMI